MTVFQKKVTLYRKEFWRYKTNTCTIIKINLFHVPCVRLFLQNRFLHLFTILFTFTIIDFRFMRKSVQITDFCFTQKTNTYTIESCPTMIKKKLEFNFNHKIICHTGLTVVHLSRDLPTFLMVIPRYKLNKCWLTSQVGIIRVVEFRNIHNVCLYRNVDLDMILSGFIV